VPYIGHGGKEIVERVISSPLETRTCVKGLKQLAIIGRIDRECIVTSPIASFLCWTASCFMSNTDVEAVCKKMTLANGILWFMPIVLDITGE